MAQLVLNFEALGSFTDDDGNRLPVEMPNALLGLLGADPVLLTPAGGNRGQSPIS